VTRIAGIPQQLAALSTVLAEAGVELSVAATSVSTAGLPSMPPGIAGQVEHAISHGRSTLQRAARTAEREASEVRRRALWLARADSGGTAGLEALFGLRALAETPLYALDTVSRHRIAEMLQAWSRYNRVVLPVVREYGETSLPATKIWLLWQRRNPMALSRLNSVIDGAGDAAKYEQTAGLPLAGLRAVAAKALGPFGMATSAYSLLHPAHAHGWERTGDRVAAGAGFLGSGGATVLAFAPELAAVPGVNVAVGALLVGAAGWEIYSHRKAIAHSVVGAGEWAWSHKVQILAATPAGPAAVAWDHRKEIARGVVGTERWGVRRAKDVEHGITGIPGQFVDGLKGLAVGLP
jgi:hypothetical protein